MSKKYFFDKFSLFKSLLEVGVKCENQRKYQVQYANCDEFCHFLIDLFFIIFYGKNETILLKIVFPKRFQKLQKKLDKLSTIFNFDTNYVFHAKSFRILIPVCCVCNKIVFNFLFSMKKPNENKTQNAFKAKGMVNFLNNFAKRCCFVGLCLGLTTCLRHLKLN